MLSLHSSLRQETTMLAVIGENVVDMLPEHNGLYRPCLGGSPFNVAIAAARQQLNVSYISPLSQDAFGQQFAATSQKAEIFRLIN